MERVMVLLGAGASRDAGLPLTAEFAVRLLDAMHRDFRADSSKVQALNFVYGAMLNHRSEQGDDPRAAVNVETMISAIRLLQQRATHEAAPFIQGWKPPVAAFRLPHGLLSAQVAQALKKGVDAALGSRGTNAGRELQRAIEQMIDSRLTGGSNASLYAELERDILDRVRELLQQPEEVQYLSPLAELASTQPSGLDVATLNYDVTVETMAAETGVEVDVGIDRWVPGTDLDFSPAEGRLNLIKVHGSIDWARRPRHLEWQEQSLARTDVVRTAEFAYGDRPAIVIGDREKLSTEGPTLALLRAFEVALWRANRLVVVGYSFGDDHVNAVIRNWINADPTRTLTVLDPGWSWASRWGSGQETFADELSRHLGSPTPSADASPPRLHVIPLGAAIGLARALNEAPALGPAPRFTVTTYENRGVITATVTNLGRPLTSVSFSAIPRRAHRPGSLANRIEADHDQARPDPHRPKTVNLPGLDVGQQVAVRLQFTNPDDTDRLLHLTIAALDGSGRITVEFQEPSDRRGTGLRYLPPAPEQ